jgi:light-regulated signal transduction histidine kinase (bacteriophytochrome)
MDADASRLAKYIVEGAARMSCLVDDLLSFATTGMHEPPQGVDLEGAVAQAIQNLTVAVRESGATVTIGRLPAVRGNQIHLVRLFQNLIDNAVKYRREDPIHIHVTAERRGPDWVIGIKDNGLGIAPEYQESVFLPFKRLANRNVPGTGLSLAVCKRIIEEFGGTIWVESELGVGSTFCFTIPDATDRE